MCQVRPETEPEQIFIGGKVLRSGVHITNYVDLGKHESDGETSQDGYGEIKNPGWSRQMVGNATVAVSSATGFSLDGIIATVLDPFENGLFIPMDRMFWTIWAARHGGVAVRVFMAVPLLG